MTASPSASAASTTTVAAAPYKPADLNGPAQNVPKPVKPPLADEFSEKGLDAFVRYWFETYNYAAQTGDTVLGDILADPTCTSCSQLLGSFKTAYDKGHWIVGQLTRIDAAQTYFTPGTDGAYQEVVQFNLAAGKYLTGTGIVGKETPEDPAMAKIFIASHANGKWLITNIGVPQ
ncbi:DUF6318 family protein [Psychromicrobium xiongbiense]|uniref:DUF6318 family protein n=1 Tax=Psychromicrobium xiongbiense TaxID=3051184 RepID=UPI002552C038|nr:DUF6318 family protein [Psychromicrobium sp. YIM S02556]